MISWRISICCGERSFPCWLGAKSSSRSLTNVFFCSSVNPERDSSSSAIWCFWYGSTPVESLRQCHRSVSTVWKRRQDDSCYGNCTVSLFHFHPKHIKARSDSERFYSNNKARTAIAWFWACQYTSNLWKISWRTYHVLWEWMVSIHCWHTFHSDFVTKKSISLYYCRNFKPKRVFFYSRKSSGWGLQ